MFDVAGKMLTGWQKSDNQWYFLNDGRATSLPTGAMCTGWIKNGPGGAWYYLCEDGHMATSTITPDGYKVDSEGRYIE